MLLKEKVLFGAGVFSADQYDSLRDLLHIAKAIAAKHGETPRSGGYFCAARADDGSPFHLSRWGLVPPSHDEKYRAYVLEKPRRLALHPTHVASSQSRNEKRNEYGGAIRTNQHLLSFSGLPELIDEPMMLAFGVKVGSLTLDEAMLIAEVTGNTPRWEEFQGALSSPAWA
jgi:hypothetical protein